MIPSSLSHVPFNETYKILDENVEKYNGRVQIAEPSETAIFDMQERINVKNKTTEYREALTGNLESSMLSKAFFSEKNIQIIQNGIRAGVYERSKGEIIPAPQNIENIKIIMRSIFLQYAENYPQDVTGQIKRLNDLVLDYAVNNVYNESVAYVNYIKDQSSLVTPMERPLQNDRDYKQLEHKAFM